MNHATDLKEAISKESSDKNTRDKRTGKEEEKNPVQFVCGFYIEMSLKDKFTSTYPESLFHFTKCKFYL